MPTSSRISGPSLFARFAYPPNALGYCGPDDSRGLLEHVAGDGVSGGQDGALRAAGWVRGRRGVFTMRDVLDLGAEAV